MISEFISSVRDRVNSGHIRTVKAKKNILASLLIKGTTISISFFLVPLTISYINPIQYGIWITLSSIIAWFSFFDIGFGNGLRNKFAQCIAKGQHEQARQYLSTTYLMLIALIAVILALFFIINPFLNWSVILNTPSSMLRELRTLVLFVFVCFCLQFIFQLITTVVTANQEPAKASLFGLFGNIASLICVLLLIKTTAGSLIYLGIALSIIPVIVLVVSSIWFYTHKYRVYAPSLKFIKLSYGKDIMKTGIKFFIIQVAVVVLFQSDNIVITQIFGPADVTVFSVAFKLFSSMTMIFAIIVTPFWSAFTEAYANTDIEWINNTLAKLKKTWLVFTIFSFLILSVSPTIFRLWIGASVTIPFSLSVSMTIYVAAYTWQTFHAFFLNGIGKIKLQLYLVVLSAIINIPLAIFLGKKIGLAGITLANTILLVVMGIFFSMQAKKIINNDAKGIWNR